MPIEAKEIFEATTKTFRELMCENGQGLYIPAYQRHYGWDKAKFEKLFDDAMHGLNRLALSSDSFTFLGSIITIHDTSYTTIQPLVLDQVPAKVLTIIDGQQRLTSLLLVAVSLHNHIRRSFADLFGGINQPPPEPEHLQWIYEQSKLILSNLETTIFERHSFGDSPVYPRVIRAFDDQWSKKKSQATYQSPIAHLVHTYVNTFEHELCEFRPEPRNQIRKGEGDLVARFNEAQKLIQKLANHETIDNIEGMPSTSEVALSEALQVALFNHKFPSTVTEALKETDANKDYEILLRKLLMASYILGRTALTVVKGKNEDYAFTIFESLNTTGEPLTAFETFVPRVVSAEGLGDYEKSDSKKSIDRTESYLGKHKVGAKLQTATSDLIVSFALAESGDKLSKRLPDQREYLKQSFEHHASDATHRRDFVRHLGCAAAFMDSAWEFGDNEPRLPDPITVTSDSTKLCLDVLRKLNHSVTLGPLIRFTSRNFEIEPDSSGNVSDSVVSRALKGIVAFSILWRSSRRGTGNIDREYREIMSSGMDEFPPLARNPKSLKASSGELSVDKFIDQLRERIIQNGKIPDKDSWVSAARELPIYAMNRTLARFLLLAAYHDSSEDCNNPGLIVAVKKDFSSCLNFSSWRDEKNLSLEHVAPQTQNQNWDVSIYKRKDTIHTLGNLVLTQLDVNSTLSDKSWKEKRTLFEALSSPSAERAKEVLDHAATRGITYSRGANELAQLSRHMPHLHALANKQDDWSEDFIALRSERLLELAWNRLAPWLDWE